MGKQRWENVLVLTRRNHHEGTTFVLKVTRCISNNRMSNRAQKWNVGLGRKRRETICGRLRRVPRHSAILKLNYRVRVFALNYTRM